MDDHVVVDAIAGRDRLPIRELPHAVLERTFEGNGRFRPLYWFGQMVESVWAGSYPATWYVDRLILAAVAMTAVLLVCRSFVGPWQSAALGSAAILGPEYEAWSRLGTAEAYAVPLLAVGLAMFIRTWRDPSASWRLGGAAALVAAALAKETLVPLAGLALAVAAVRLWRAGQVHGTQRRAWTAWVLLCVVLLADAALLAGQLHAYGDQYHQVRSPSTLIAWDNFFLQNAIVFDGLAFVSVLLVLVLARTRDRRNSLAVGCVLLLIASQVMSYAGAPMVGRYLLPALFGVTALWLLCLGERGLPVGAFNRPVLRALSVLAYASLAVSVALGAYVSHGLASRNAAATRTFRTSSPSSSAKSKRTGLQP